MTTSTTPGVHRPRIALAVLAAAQFLLILDSAIVNVALATIDADLGFGAADLTWVVNAYALAFGGLLLAGGRLADVVGARRVFVTGIALFAAASAAGAAAWSPAALVAARAVQGVGAALVAPAALALVAGLFPDAARRSRAIAVLGVTAGAGGSSGLVVGGLLTASLGWRSVLWINVPVALAVLVMSRRLPAGRTPHPDRRLDLGGAALATAGVGLLVYAVVGTATAGWVSGTTLGLLAVSALLLVAFVALESVVRSPMLPLAMLAGRTLRAANVAALLTMAAMFPMWFLLTLYLQQVLGRGPVAAGLAVVPLSATLMVTNSLAPRVLSRIGTRRTLAGGLLLAAVGLAWLAHAVTPDGSALALVPASLLTGAGFGVAFVAAIVAATSSAPPQYAGAASGLLSTSQQVGGALGLAALMTLAAGRTAEATGGASGAALAAGFRAGLAGAAGLALLGATLAAVLVPRPPGPAAVTRPSRAAEPARVGPSSLAGSGRARKPGT